MRTTEAEPDVRSYAVTHRAGTFVLPHDPDWSTLVYASRGVLTITTPDGAWVVPPQRAVHVEAGIVPQVTVRGRASMRVLYLRVPLAVDGAGCTVVDVSPLLRELILRMLSAAPLALHRPHDRDLVAVFSHEIGSSRAESALRLPMPTNPQLRVFAEILVAELSRPRPEVAVARDCGFGMRTLERMFVVDTGLTIGQWPATNADARGAATARGQNPGDHRGGSGRIRHAECFRSGISRRTGDLARAVLRRRVVSMVTACPWAADRGPPRQGGGRRVANSSVTRNPFSAKR